LLFAPPFMYDTQTIAKNIRNARLYRNYSQDYIALKLNISQNAYSKVELGYTKPTLDRISRIAAVLGVEVIKLIGINNMLAEVEAVNRIAMVPKILEIICRTTGMGFAAVARVTEDRWIACSVRDEILFGLKPGDELKLETTICNEIRQSGRAVIMDEVGNNDSPLYRKTAAMYGFQSYISMPIFLQDGSFFGTLCAIDPKPAKINNTRVIEMFKLFADLISFHLNLEGYYHSEAFVGCKKIEVSDPLTALEA